MGDHVEQGQVVATVEAMKAEHEVRSPVAGVVKQIHMDIGTEVSSDQAIISLEG